MEGERVEWEGGGAEGTPPNLPQDFLYLHVHMAPYHQIPPPPPPPTDPEDYLGLSGMLILAIGEREVCVNITIIPDEVYELSIEVFAVCIGSDDPDVVTVFGKSLVNIIDNTSKQDYVDYFVGS